MGSCSCLGYQAVSVRRASPSFWHAQNEEAAPSVLDLSQMVSLRGILVIKPGIENFSIINALVSSSPLPLFRTTEQFSISLTLESYSTPLHGSQKCPSSLFQQTRFGC